MVVLVVDDEPDLRELLKDEFEMAGWTVLEARSGEEAYGILQKNRFDAVVTDVRMPGGSGLDLLRRYAKTLDTTPNAGKLPFFVLLTGFADLDEAEAMALGAGALIQKPFDLRQMMATVKAGARGTATTP